MLEDLWTLIRAAFGVGVEELSLWHIIFRAISIYLVTLAMVRLGDGKRLIGKLAAFDVILGIIFGSVLSRAVNGEAPFFETIGAGVVLIGLHWIFAALAFRTHRFGKLIKGNTWTLISQGQIQWDNMRKNRISERELIAALRVNGQVTGPEQVEVAYLERNGDISAIPRKHDPKIVEVAVQKGVQTVRIELQ